MGWATLKTRPPPPSCAPPLRPLAHPGSAPSAAATHPLPGRSGQSPAPWAGGWPQGAPGWCPGGAAREAFEDSAAGVCPAGAQGARPIGTPRPARPPARTAGPNPCRGRGRCHPVPPSRVCLAGQAGGQAAPGRAPSRAVASVSAFPLSPRGKKPTFRRTDALTLPRSTRLSPHRASPTPSRTSSPRSRCVLERGVACGWACALPAITPIGRAEGKGGWDGAEAGARGRPRGLLSAPPPRRACADADPAALEARGGCAQLHPRPSRGRAGAGVFFDPFLARA